MIKTLRALLVLAAAITATPAWATTYFVAAGSGNNANACTDWSVPCQTVAGALAKATPTIIAVDAAGTFTATAAITWTLPATTISIISSTNGTIGTTITPSAGAVEGIGAASNNFTITSVSGTSLYVFGMHLISSTNAAANLFAIGSGGNANSTLYFDGTTFELAGASTGQVVSTSAVSFIQFTNCTFLVSGSRAGAILSLGAHTVNFANPTITTSGATKPVTLIADNSSGSPIFITMRDGDISGFATAASALVSLTGFNAGEILFKNLKTSATPTITSGTWPTAGSGAIILRNVDSGNTVNNFEVIESQGTLTIDTANFLTAATQFNGSALAWKIVTTSVASPTNPFRSPLIEQWNTNTSPQTLNVEFAQNSSATALTDQDIWSTQDYPNSGSFPSYSIGSNRNAAPITGTPSNQTSSAVAWTGLTTPTTQKLANTFTAAANGLLQARVSIGVATKTVYINPGLTP